MNETEKELQRYVLLLSCLGIVVMAGHGTVPQPWRFVLGTLAFSVGLRHARAAVAGSAPVTRVLAVLWAALLVSGGIMIVSGLFALEHALVLMAVRFHDRPGSLTNLIMWAGHSAGGIVLVVVIAFALLRLAARTANKS